MSEEEHLKLSKRNYWLGVITIVLTMITGLVSGAVIVGAYQQRMVQTEEAVDKHEARITTLEAETHHARRVMDRVEINLKNMIESRGGRYIVPEQ